MGLCHVRRSNPNPNPNPRSRDITSPNPNPKWRSNTAARHADLSFLN